MQIPCPQRAGKNSNHLPTLQGKDDKTHIKEVVNLEAWENEDDKHLRRQKVAAMRKGRRNICQSLNRKDDLYDISNFLFKSVR